MPQLKVNDTPWDSKYPKTVPSIEVDLVRINDKPTGRDQIFNVHLWWVAARCWETRPWVWQCRNSLSLDRRSHCTLSTPEHTLAPKLGSGSPTFLEGSIVVFVHLLFCFVLFFRCFLGHSITRSSKLSLRKSMGTGDLTLLFPWWSRSNCKGDGDTFVASTLWRQTELQGGASCLRESFCDPKISHSLSLSLFRRMLVRSGSRDI